MGFWAFLKGEEPDFITKFFNYKNKGQYGEFLIGYALDGNLPGEYLLLSNLYIPYRDYTTEIDLVMLHEKGIFVFESKNYGGWIFGCDEWKRWVQSLPGGTKNHFFNPIMQNEIHMKALARLLKADRDCMVSGVVFSDRCQLKDVPKSTNECFIVYKRKLVKTVKKILRRRDCLFTPSEIREFYKILVPLTEVRRREKKRHIKQIHERHEGTVCPVCSGELVVREGMYGPFLGCSNYPKCRYTRDL